MKEGPVDVLIPLPSGFKRCTGYEWLPDSEEATLIRERMAAVLDSEDLTLNAVWLHLSCGPCSNILGSAINQRRTWISHLRNKRRRMVPSFHPRLPVSKRG